MNIKHIFRHGDNLIREVESLLPNVKELDTKTIAYGEVTGHHHTFTGPYVKIYEGEKEKKYIEITSPSPLTHQEHKTIVVDPGTYEVVREREFDYIEMELKRVTD